MAFKAELVAEVAKLNPDVEVFGIECGSVLITLQGDSADSVDAIAHEIETNGVDLPTFGKVGGPTEIEKGTKDSGGFPAWAIVIICLAVIGAAAAGIYYYQQATNAQKETNVAVKENATQIPQKVGPTPASETKNHEEIDVVPSETGTKLEKKKLEPSSNPPSPGKNWRPTTVAIDDHPDLMLKSPSPI